MKKLLSRSVFAILCLAAVSLPAQSPIEVDTSERCGIFSGFSFAPLQLGIDWIGALNSGGMVQIGLCNSEGDLQIGVLNYNPKAPIPWMPLLNFSRRGGD